MNDVLVAMSGGVDSSAAAALLKEEGHQIVGCTMQLWDYRRNPSRNGVPQVGKCCSLDDVYDARRVADHLGFKFYVLNLQEEFERKVIEPFIDSYLKGKTPIPCTLCNTFLKFDRLLLFARQIGISRVATGHYARLTSDAQDGYMLLKGKDAGKDQSYYLFELTQEQLSSISFPVGHYEKGAIREIAHSRGLLTATKPESQEICFIPDGDYPNFIRRHASEVNKDLLPLLERADQSGPILFKDGSHLGTHSGVFQFTVGQRRGIGVAHHKPLYVLRSDIRRNILVVGYREDLYSCGLIAERVNWISGHYPRKPVRAKVKIRSRHEEASALIVLEKVKEGADLSWRAKVTFEIDQMSVTPGQAVVFYDGERVLGGGWIVQKIPPGESQ
jgi:tRNA-specific 2-thiouridylase